MNNNYQLKYEIAEIYRKLLLREPDMDSLKFWIHQIENKKADFTDLQNMIAKSDEFKMSSEFKNGFTKTSDGFHMYLNSKDNFLSRYIAYNKNWEPHVGNFLKNIIKETWNVADIGANIGYFTLLLSKLVGSSGKVYSFEPESQNYEILKKNITKNNLQNIFPFQKAVSNKAGKSKLYKSNWNFGDHRLFETLSFDNDKTHVPIDIDTIKLDDVLLDINLDFLKIDVQGHEMHVIEGAEKIINEKNDFKMIVEFWPHGLSASKIEPLDFLNKLLDMGFDIFNLSAANTLVNFDLEEICRRHAYHSSLELFCEK